MKKLSPILSLSCRKGNVYLWAVWKGLYKCQFSTGSPGSTFRSEIARMWHLWIRVKKIGLWHFCFLINSPQKNCYSQFLIVFFLVFKIIGINIFCVDIKRKGYSDRITLAILNFNISVHNVKKHFGKKKVYECTWKRIVV